MESSAGRQPFDRRLYGAAAILFPLIVLIGFSRTYYLKTVFGTPPLPSTLVHLHGLAMTAWVALFVVQVSLVSVKRVALHRRLGYAGVGIGALILLTGVPMTLRAAKYGSASAPAGIPPLSFLIIPFGDLIVFALLFGSAIYLRRRPVPHKRLMLLTAISLLPPALGRMPVASLLALGPVWFLGFPAAVALFCVALDSWRYRRVNAVFASATVLLICSYVARLALMNSDTWMGIAVWLTSFV